MKWSFLLFSSFLCLQAIAQYPATGNKMRLGWQTTGDGLVYRGAIGDTATLDPSGLNNAWMLLDTANGNLYAYRAKAWRLVSGGGGGSIGMPFDSVTFNVNENDASLRELKYSEEKGYLQYGGQDSVQIPLLPGVWYVRNDTSVTIPKGTVVRASGTLGASGRIKVKHMIANGTIDAMYVLGIAMQDIAAGADGYVMTQGKIRQVNTQAYSEGAVLYADVDTVGGLTQTEPTGSNLKLPIAFVVHSASNGTLAVRVSPGTYLRDLHDVYITSPDSSASLYYNTSESVWRDTTAAVLTSDTSVFARDFQISGTTNRLAMFTAGNRVGNSQVFDNGTNVGLGNTNPVSGNGGGLTIGSPSAGKGLHLYLSGSGLFMYPSGSSNPSFQMGSSDADSSILYYTYFNYSHKFFTTNVERFRISHTGNVGIGTASPARILHVAATSAIRIPVGTTSDRGTSADGDIRYNTTNTNFEWYSGTGWREPVNAARSPAAGLANRFSKFDANGLLDTSAVLTQANGRIGIWNSSPASSDSVLTVTGGIYTTNGVRVNNGVSNFFFTPSGSVPGEIPTLGLTHTATSAQNSLGGISALALTAQTPNTSFTYGTQGSQGINAARIRAFHSASSTLVQLNGVNLTARNLGSGTITLANGGNFVVGNSSQAGSSANGRIIDARGGTFTLQNSPNARITNLYGAYFIMINDNDTAGSIGNIYGTYLEPITGGNAAAVSVTNLYGYYIPAGWSNKATNKWSFYADDVNAPLYSAGKIGAGVTTPTAVLHLKAGTASANTAPLKFTSGTNLTTPEAGAVEWNGTNVFVTNSSATRQTVNQGLTGSATMDFPNTDAQKSSDLTITVTGASDGDVVSLGVSNAAINANTCYTAWVSAANTVTIRFNNYSTGAINPAQGNFKVFVTKF